MFRNRARGVRAQETGGRRPRRLRDGNDPRRRRRCRRGRRRAFLSPGPDPDPDPGALAFLPRAEARRDEARRQVDTRSDARARGGNPKPYVPLVTRSSHVRGVPPLVPERARRAPRRRRAVGGGGDDGVHHGGGRRGRHRRLRLAAVTRFCRLFRHRRRRRVHQARERVPARVLTRVVQTPPPVPPGERRRFDFGFASGGLGKRREAPR